MNNSLTLFWKTRLNILATKKRIKKTAFMVRRYCFAFDDENSGFLAFLFLFQIFF